MDDFFLYNQNCTYILSKMLLGPRIQSDLRTDRPGYNPMIGRLGTDFAVAGVLGFRGYPPCHLQRFVDQMMQEDG